MPVVLVVGPPCAGKTTYVATRAAAGDTVADFDTFARAAGSPVAHGHAHEHRRTAGDAMDNLLAAIAAGRYVGTAWVIRSLPEPARRRRVAQALRAELVVLDPGAAECMARAARDGRPASCRQGIFEWYRRAGLA